MSLGFNLSYLIIIELVMKVIKSTVYGVFELRVNFKRSCFMLKEIVVVLLILTNYNINDCTIIKKNEEVFPTLYFRKLKCIYLDITI